ncbi:hypothetical protein I6G66_06190 [Delftia acidovorans]|uniref:Uncharacterized protein n=1 Tax=Delftia acidovorans TaxID=80866 RepID=A0A7T2W0D3_DELAC|nr:hypothetical protein [Delftia acidovorans]QPS09610.1 hypothetical protein I6G66_06190 [Delftia acidovorans]
MHALTVRKDLKRPALEPSALTSAQNQFRRTLGLEGAVAGPLFYSLGWTKERRLKNGLPVFTN